MDLYSESSHKEHLLRYNEPSPEEYLTHHGILGMKWGVRNGPPYPLDVADHSISEKRAGWRKSLDNGQEKADNRKQAKASGPQKRGLTDKQKRALKIGATVAVTTLAIYGGYKFEQSGKLDPLIEQGKQRLQQLLGDDRIRNQNVGSFSEPIAKSVQQVASDGFKTLSHRETIHEAVTKVNPSGARTNCRACSIASVLRMRGMDVEALGSVQGGTLREAVEESFKGAKVAEIYSPSKERITNYILKRCGEGSSGVMAARYKMSTGIYEHAISWAVKDGVLSFFDGQKGLADCSKYLNFLTPDGSAEIVRLDNLELNFDGIKKYIKGL